MGRNALRVAVGGLRFGAHVHVAAFGDLPGVEVVALLGRDINHTLAEAERLGIAHARTRVSELLDLDVDLITLALPPTESAQAAEEVLRAKVPLFCEKPLAADLTAARRLVELAGSTPQAINFQFAELPVFQTLHRQIHAETFGPVRAVRIEWNTLCYAQKHRCWSWKTDEARGGGVLSLNGSHLLYLCEWLFGPCQSIEADLSNTRTVTFAPPRTNAADDHAQLRLHHGQVQVDIVLDNARLAPHLHRWSVACEGGTFVLENTSNDYMSGFRLAVQTPQTRRQLSTDVPSTAKDGRIAPCQAIAQRIVQQVRGGPPCTPDLGSGLRVQRLIHAARQSARQGQAAIVAP